jgi:uncharacterized membrane protein YbaN (DUF454 family)
VPAEQPPEPTELIYLPRSSWLPALTALGIAMVVLGIFTWFPYLIAGAAIALVSLWRWLRGSRDEIARLPRRQRQVTAVIPLRSGR